MGWPALCFPKEELKTGNGWGQRGTIWRNPSAPSCQGFPTSAVMEKTRERRRAVPTHLRGWRDPAAPQTGIRAALALRHRCHVCRELCQWHRGCGTKRASQGRCCPGRAVLGPRALPPRRCASFQAFAAQPPLPQPHPPVSSSAAHVPARRGTGPSGIAFSEGSCVKAMTGWEPRHGAGSGPRRRACSQCLLMRAPYLHSHRATQINSRGSGLGQDALPRKLGEGASPLTK